MLSKSGWGLILLAFVACNKPGKRNAVVLQTDFGVKDGAVAAMKGVVFETDPELPIFDLTHEIPAYNIWEAAYRLNQSIAYWPAGTVFVSVVDPGVGTERKSVVAKTRKGHYIVTPDNGTLTMVAESEGIEALRSIDEAVNRRAGSSGSYTFHGRDVYVYTAARLASGKISFEQVGPALDPATAVKFSYQHAELSDGSLNGNIPVLDVQYGNVWTNITGSLVGRAGFKPGDSLNVRIYKDRVLVYDQPVFYAHTFGDVAEGKPLAYLNSLMNLSLALNMGDFAKTHGVGYGPLWSVAVTKKN